MRFVLAVAVPLCVLAGSAIPDTVWGLYTKAPGDSVRISKLKNGKAKVESRLVFGAGQSCLIEGEAEWKENVLTLQAEGVDDSKPCRLEMRFSGEKITLADPQGRCRPVYCGPRGTFEGAVLTKAAAKSKAKK
jgi:hypothetical protein